MTTFLEWLFIAWLLIVALGVARFAWREYRKFCLLYHRELWLLRKLPPPPQYHPNGVPVGLYPGDPIPRENYQAILDYLHDIAPHARDAVLYGRIDVIEPGMTVAMEMRRPDE